MTTRVLVISTPVAPLGAGPEGGIRLVVRILSHTLPSHGFSVRVLVPSGSRLEEGVALEEVSGALHPSASVDARRDPPATPPESVLAAMCSRARLAAERGEIDLVLNLAYDPLPYELTIAGSFGVPVAHYVSMGSLSDVMDGWIGTVAERYPGTVAMQTAAQAATFPFPRTGIVLVGGGVEIERYSFRPKTESGAVAWAGRIAPEKGLPDAFQAAALAGVPLHVMGAMQDEGSWQAAIESAPNAVVKYLGFLPTEQLQDQLGRCRGLLVTPRWDEAFGLVVAEALACGVPVVSYRRGGPAELIQHGETGFLIEPGDVAGLAAAIGELDRIDRAACRRQAESQLSANAFGRRLANWLHTVAS